MRYAAWAGGLLLLATVATFAAAGPAGTGGTQPGVVDDSPINGTRTVNFQQLQAMLENHPDDVLVVNFWATWCEPCVENLPTMAKLAEAYKGRHVRILLVSFDDPEDAPAVKERLTKAGFNGGSLILDPKDRAACVNALSPKWKDIAVPANFVYDRTGRQRHEWLLREHTLEAWRAVIEPVLGNG